MIGDDVPALVRGGVFEEGHEFFEVEDGDAMGAAAGDQSMLAVGRDEDISRIGKVKVVPVEQHLVDSSIFPGDANPIGDRPTTVDPGHGDQVLGAEHGEERILATGVPVDALE